ncbi:MAG: hypothetical protein NZ899_01585 [Thermoguttaceae bacterium]|nr:hypothetical protein [Thermoguttaceae bacterium]MDW8078626.1 hypothetical protein [Thermoguttaceae bacterium]
MGGKLPEDNFVDLAVDDRYVYISTAAPSVRIFDKKTWRELPSGESSVDVVRVFARPSAFEFHGKAFAVAIPPQGPWQTVDPHSRLEITCLGDGQRMITGTLRP